MLSHKLFHCRDRENQNQIHRYESFSLGLNTKLNTSILPLFCCTDNKDKPGSEDTDFNDVQENLTTLLQ